MTFLCKKKPKAVVSLTRKELIVYLHKYPNEIHLSFDEKTLINMDKVDESLVMSQVSSFLSNNKVQQHDFILFLPDDILFSRLIEAKEASSAQEQYQKFVKDIPLEHASTLSKLILLKENSNKYIAVGTNQKYVLAVMNSFVKASWSCLSIIPEINTEQLQININTLLSYKGRPPEALDLLESVKIHPLVTTNHSQSPSSKKQTILLIIAIALFLASAAIIGIYLYSLRRTPKPYVNDSLPSNKIMETTESTLSPFKEIREPTQSTRSRQTTQSY